LNKKVHTSFNKESYKYIWILIWGKSGTDFLIDLIYHERPNDHDELKARIQPVKTSHLFLNSKCNISNYNIKIIL